MNTLIDKLNNYLSKYGLYFFAIATLILMFTRVPYWDETHAFNIARMNISEILYLTRVEGHTFLWYFIIKPFSKLEWFPYSIWIINWLFCMGAVFVMWKKAPFSPIVKTLIMFSVPFLMYFGPIARCYSVGLLFLFLACSYYPIRFKKPYIYATFLVIAANTSVMLAIGSFCLGVHFLWECYQRYRKNIFVKKKLINILLIFFITGLLLLVQFVGVTEPQYVKPHLFLDNLYNFAIYPYAKTPMAYILRVVCSFAFYFFAFYIFIKSKKAFFLISSIYFLLIMLFTFVYSGGPWNHYFFFVYFIVVFWLYGKKLLKNKFAKGLFVAILILFTMPFAVHPAGKINLLYSSKAKNAADLIMSFPEIKNSKLYSIEWWNDLFPGASVYLEREGVDIFDIKGRNRRSFESMKNIFKMRFDLIDFDDFYKIYEKDKGFIFATNEFFNHKYINMEVEKLEYEDFLIKTDEAQYLLKSYHTDYENSFVIYTLIKK